MLHKDITLATRTANKGLSPMDLSGSASQTPEKWRKRKRAFEYYAKGWRSKTSLKICKILVPFSSQVTMLLKSRFAN